MSIFDVMGPIMVGPSSSHTAGACKIGYLARQVYGKSFQKVRITLFNSFADTGKGHGTDKAIVAGVLGIKMDDEKIVDSFDIAQQQGVTILFELKQDNEKHPNTAQIDFYGEEGLPYSITGISVGGGNAKIIALNDRKVEFAGKHAMLVITSKDVPGVMAFIGETLKDAGINIAYMQMERDINAGESFSLCKLDNACSEEMVKKLEMHKYITEVIHIPKLYTTLS